MSKQRRSRTAKTRLSVILYTTRASWVDTCIALLLTLLLVNIILGVEQKNGVEKHYD
jgi:hypothetical protein